jgi:hypothetical protein
MDATVNLYHKPVLVTIEVDNGATDRILTAEFEAVEATISKASPEQRLGTGEMFAEFTAQYEDVVGQLVIRVSHGCSPLTPNPSPRGRGAGVRA